MSFPERPRLRPTITGQVDPEDPRFVWLYDQARFSRYQLRMPREAVLILEQFNGEQTLRDVQAELMRALGGQLVPLEVVQQLARTLDEALFLDGEKFEARCREFLQSPIREPACIGSYAGEPEALRDQLDGLFTHEKGPGKPERTGPDDRLGGALIPHIDFHRGGPTFAWGFREIVEHCDATTFVILGTAHYSTRRFTLTRKDFRTPLGIMETHKDYVQRIADCYGEEAFADEIAHLPEHSIEFQVVLLQHCLGNRRDVRIVPIVVGSFQDCVAEGVPPEEQADIYLMLKALRQAEAESGERVCYIASGDLAHIGPKFGDSTPVDQATLEWSRRQDHQLLNRAAAGDLAGFFQVILDEKDSRRTCGFPPTYVLMSLLQPKAGKVLHYDQYVDPSGHESVSFASVAFYRQPEKERNGPDGATA